MIDETHPDASAADAPQDPDEDAAEATHEQAEAEAAVAAETASCSDTEQAPASTGPMITPPPVAGWDDTAPAAAKTQGSTRTVVAAAVIVALIIGALAGVAGGFAGAQLASTGAMLGGATFRPTTSTVPTGAADEPVIAAAAAAVPSVVNIDVTGSPDDSGSDSLPDNHPSVPQGGQGSGVAFKAAADGGTYILTNHHVIENAKSITVRSTSGKSWPGTVVGSDPDNDIAVVKISVKIPTIVVGNSKNLVVGQTVVAIGSPFGLEHSVTSGVISAMGRSLPDFAGDTAGNYPLIDVIQTDAAINPGNSGGALVDRAGRLVGINTAIYSESGTSGGIGFAVPVNKATDVAEQLISSGSVSHPFIGIIGVSLTPAIVTAEKYTVSEGALVREIAQGSGSQRAGVRVGDVVVSVDGVDVRSMDDLILLVRRRKAGDTVKLKVIRDGKPLELGVKVGDRPADYTTTTTPTPEPKK